VSVTLGNNAKYLKYLNDAKEKNLVMKIQHIKVLLSGPAAAGKSSFGRLLFGSHFSANYESTEILEANQGIAVMKPFDDDKSVAVKRYSLLKQNNKSVWLKRDFKSQLSQLKMFLNRRIFYKSNVVSNASAQHVESSISSGSSDSVDHSLMDDKPPTNVESKIINSLELPDSYEIGDAVKMITIVDTGGQPEYVMLLPAINSMPNINFVVHDLTKNLDELVEVRYKRKGHDEAHPYFLHYSYLDMIQLLMCFITDSVELSANVANSQQCYAKPKKSYISFVGTHYDEICKKDEKEKIEILQAVDNKLCSVARGRNCYKFLLQPKKYIIFPVDNTGESKAEGAEVQLIREEVERLAKDTENVELPLKWIYLELEMQEIQDKNYISYEEYERIAKECAFLTDKDEIAASLEYFHVLGVVLHFRLCNWVIINHQWLFYKLTEIMHLSAEDVDFTRDSHSMEKFKDTRLLAKYLLKEGCINLKHKGISKEELPNLLTILEELKVITTVTIKQEKYYYLPSALPSTMQYNDNCRFLLCEPLLIRFKSGFLPRGFFCSLVSHLLADLPEGWEHQLGSVTTKHYSNVITFCISDENFNDIYLRLHDKTYYLELQVRHFDRDVKSSHQREIFPVLQKYLENVCIQLNLECSRVEYGFFCHSDKSYSADDHMVVCNPDEPLPPVLKCGEKHSHKTCIGEAHTVWFSKVHIPDCTILCKLNYYTWMHACTNMIE